MLGGFPTTPWSERHTGSSSIAILPGRVKGSHANPVGSGGVQALHRELGSPPPRGVAALADADLAALAEALGAAKAEQRQAMAAAGEAAFGHIPALLRRPLRKLLGG
jgi:hypothetical protein